MITFESIDTFGMYVNQHINFFIYLDYIYIKSLFIYLSQNSPETFISCQKREINDKMHILINKKKKKNQLCRSLSLFILSWFLFQKQASLKRLFKMHSFNARLNINFHKNKHPLIFS